MPSLSPELETLANTAIEQIANAHGLGSMRKTVEANVFGAIWSIFNHEARIKGRTTPDSDAKREERRKRYLRHFSNASPDVAQKIVDLAMQ